MISIKEIMSVISNQIVVPVIASAVTTIITSKIKDKRKRRQKAKDKLKEVLIKIEDILKFEIDRFSSDPDKAKWEQLEGQISSNLKLLITNTSNN